MAARIHIDIFRVLIPHGLHVSIAELIPQSLQLQAQIMTVSLSCCHKLGQCGKSQTLISVRFCSWSSGGASIYLFT